MVVRLVKAWPAGPRRGPVRRWGACRNVEGSSTFGSEKSTLFIKTGLDLL